MAAETFLLLSTPTGGNLLNTGAPLNIKGETLDPNHVGAIEVLSFAFGSQNPTTIGSVSGGAGAGKAKFEEFVITKNVDATSPALYLATAAGAHFPTLTLAIRKAVGTATDYLTFDFRMAFVTTIEWSGGAGQEAPQETVHFIYGALGINYTPVDASGKPLAKPLIGQWSVVLNQENLNVPG